MAAGDDDGEDSFVFPFRQQVGDTTSQKESSQWSESCYGIWLKDKTRDERNKDPVCLGINIIHITKRVMNSKIKPSNTKGIQIIIEEMASEDKAKLLAKDEDFGEDGMIAYRAPKIKDKQKDSDFTNQPTLIENMMEHFEQRVSVLKTRYHKYKDDPATMKEIWSEFKDGLQGQYETGKRLLSYVKPAERLFQVNTFIQNHYKNAMNWFDEKSEK